MATREKSNLYPNATWEESLEFAKTIADFNLKVVSYSEVAKKYGLTSTTTKSFTARISTSKQFGLISTSSGSVQLTDLAKKILYPTTGDVKLIKIEAFRLPPLYDKLISRYDGKALPSKEILENILMNEYRIAKNAKSKAASCFLESASQLSLINGGVLYYSDSLNAADQFEIKNEELSESNQNIETTSSDSILHNERTEIKAYDSSSDYIIQKIPVESGKLAQIIVPVDSTEDDILLIKDMFDVLLRRKFKIKFD